MKLRPRKISSEPSNAGKKQAESDLPCDDGSVDLPECPSEEAIYVLSSDSDDSDCSYGGLLEETKLSGSKKRKKRPRIGTQVQPGSNSSPNNNHSGNSNSGNLELGPSTSSGKIKPSSGTEALPKTRRRQRARKGKSKRSKKVMAWQKWEEENERWIDENIARDVELDSQNGFIADVAEAPSQLTIPLLRYQKEWLAWSLKQEESEIGGGILADEMGMGKTLQAISLTLAKREIVRKIRPSGSSSSGKGPDDLAETSATLVVCPLIAVSQWVSEIDRFTAEGSTTVLVYHGACRGKNSKPFGDYDFVITTYSTVENEFRKHVLPPKEKCCYCGKSFHQEKLKVHLRYFCGPHAVRTEKQTKQDKKKVQTRPFRKRVISLARKGKQGGEGHDGGSTGRSNFSNDSTKEKLILHGMKWNRIILDEAHYIKDKRSNTARAIFALESSFKWALSGTPLQNRVGELYSLIRFLSVVPYSYYLCKDCNCLTLDCWSFTGCSNCIHGSVRHFCWWNKYIAKPMQFYGNLNPGKRAMILLKHKVLSSIVLRRTKSGRAADLALPPRIIMLRRDSLDVKEEDYYKSLYNESQAQFNTYVNAGTLMNNYAHIFDLLTRLRQALDHPYLVVYSRSASLKRENKAASLENCGICGEPSEDAVVTSCSHVFCKACLLDFSNSATQVLCPTCSKLLTVDLVTSLSTGDGPPKTRVQGFRSSSILNRIQLTNFQSSTKIEALREEIRFMVERDGSAKGIVFSQFTSFLDLINYSLNKSGVGCVQLVGSMSLLARNVAIKKFTEDPDCRVFLMSLKAGGVALNLTVASHVFLMDPWWNPAVEQQAQDRIHRIGQYKPIRIVRFIIENTIEERILKLQEKKELVFEGTVGGSMEALGKLTGDDMQFLFIT